MTFMVICLNPNFLQRGEDPLYLGGVRFSIPLSEYKDRLRRGESITVFTGKKAKELLELGR